MLNISTKLSLNKAAIDAPNLCDRFQPDELDRLGQWVYDGYYRDDQSRTAWKRRTEAAMDLALQIQRTKTFPWPNCSNVKFPLVTIAAMQFHAMAYPVLVVPPGIVQYRVVGEDPTGMLRQRAERIGEHMSYQVLEADPNWEPDHDKLLLNNAIIGTTFKKSYYSANRDTNISEMVMAKDLVLDYWSKSVETSPRKTHIIPMSRNDIYERSVSELFRDVREEAWFRGFPSYSTNPQQAQQDNRQGVNKPAQPDETTNFRILESHILADLDQDGYAEPYIISIEEASKKVVRVVTRFNSEDDIEKIRGEIYRIRATEHFTKYGFIPSPDGGIYDIGFGILLGPLNESVNSLINQIVDAGTVMNTAGGFLGKGAKLRGGVYQFSPFNWARVDGSGDDLRKNMVPLPVREPSSVLFQLLGLLVNYTNRISGSNDIMVGENPGQNMPAETHRRLEQMGARIYSAIFKRHWRCMKDEFKKLYLLNAHFLASKKPFGSKGAFIMQEDYKGDPNEIVPVADPNVTSDQMRLMQAQTLLQLSGSVPGFQRDAVTRRVLKAMRVEAIDEIFPGSDKTGPLPNPKVMVEQLKIQSKGQDRQLEMLKFTTELQEERRLNAAKILELNAKAAHELEQAGGVKTGHMIAAFEAQIGALKVHDEMLRGRIETMLNALETMYGTKSDSGQGGVGGMAPAPMLQGLLGAPPQQPGGAERGMG